MHWAHATHQQTVVVWRKPQGKDAAKVAVALDDAPAGEVGRGPAGHLLARAGVPDANLSHQVAGSHKLAVVAEGDRLHRRHVGQAQQDLTGVGGHHTHRRLPFRGRLILVAASEVLAGDRGDERLIR